MSTRGRSRTTADVDTPTLHVLGPHLSDQDLVGIFHKIGTIEEWADRCGKTVGHSGADALRIATIVRLGSEEWPFPEFERTEFIAKFPGVTKASWWVFLFSDDIGDEELYKHLCAYMLGTMFDPVRHDASAAAHRILKAVARTVGEDSCREMETFCEHKGKGKEGGKGAAAANTEARNNHVPLTRQQHSSTKD